MLPRSKNAARCQCYIANRNFNYSTIWKPTGNIHSEIRLSLPAHIVYVRTCVQKPHCAWWLLLYLGGAIFLFFVLYPFVIEPILIALCPHRTGHQESKESILFTIFICALGIWAQSLSSPEGFTFNSYNALFILLIFTLLIDLIPDYIKKGKKNEWYRHCFIAYSV